MGARVMSVGSRLRQLSSTRLRAIGGVRPGWNPLTADVFVDSVNGSDSNAGTYNAPKQTLAGASAILTGTKSLALFRGSSWRETLNVPYSGFKLGVVGSGNPPQILGSAITSGWTQPNVGTYPTLWSISFNRTGPATSNAETLSFFADGALFQYATGGFGEVTTTLNRWWASPRVPTGAGGSLSATVYLNIATNPNSNGVVYTISKRNCGIAGNAHDLTGSPDYTAEIYGPIEIRDCCGHYNALSGGKGIQQQQWLRYGSIHHCVTEALLLQDVLFSDFDPTQTQSPLAVYTNDGTGRAHTSRRLVFCGDGSGNQSGWFAHTNSSPLPWDTLSVDQCVIDGVTTGVEVEKTVSGLTVTNTAVTNASKGIKLAVGSNTIQRLFYYSSTPGGGTWVGLDGAGPDTSARVSLTEDSVFYWPAGSATGALRAGGAADSHTFRRCIIYADSVANFFAFTMTAGNTLRIENCIILVNNAGTRFLSVASGLTYFGSNNLWVGSNNGWNYNGTLYAASNLAGFAAATGQESGSVYSASTSGLFSGTVANGDFTLASTGLGATARSMGVGPSSSWNYNTRAFVATPPVKKPTPPANTAARRTYISDTTAYDWYA